MNWSKFASYFQKCTVADKIINVKIAAGLGMKREAVGEGDQQNNVHGQQWNIAASEHEAVIFKKTAAQNTVAWLLLQTQNSVRLQLKCYIF